VSADPPDTARVHAVCFADRTIRPDDPPAAARRQDMRSGCAFTLGSCLPAELRHGPGLGEHVPAAPAELLHVRERPRSGLGEPASVKQACRIRFWRRCSPVGCVKIQISFEFFKKKTVFP